MAFLEICCFYGFIGVWVLTFHRILKFEVNTNSFKRGLINTCDIQCILLVIYFLSDVACQSGCIAVISSCAYLFPVAIFSPTRRRKMLHEEFGKEGGLWKNKSVVPFVCKQSQVFLAYFNHNFQCTNVEVYFRPRGSFPRPAETSAVTPLLIVWLSDASTKDADGYLIPPGEAPADNLPTESVSFSCLLYLIRLPLVQLLRHLPFVELHMLQSTKFSFYSSTGIVLFPVQVPRIQPSFISSFVPLSTSLCALLSLLGLLGCFGLGSINFFFV